MGHQGVKFKDFFFFRKYEELAKVVEETKKNFAAYERDDLKLREVGRFLLLIQCSTLMLVH